MATLNRKQFLRSVAGTAAGLMSFPGVLFGAPAQGTPRAKIEDLGIVDLHCHPSLKMVLLGRRIWEYQRWQPAPGANLFAM